MIITEVSVLLPTGVGEIGDGGNLTLSSKALRKVSSLCAAGSITSRRTR